MATITELINEASEIRDAELEQENTAFKVGTTLVNIIEYLGGMSDNVAEQFAAYFTDGHLKEAVLPSAFVSALSTAIEACATHDSDNLLDLLYSRIILLDSMGSELDGVNYTPSAGDLVWRSNYVFRWDGSDWGNGIPPRKHVVYINKHTRKLYMHTGSAMVEIGNGYADKIQISKMDQSSVDNIPVGKLHFVVGRNKLVYRISANEVCEWTPSTKLIYIDVSTNTIYRWQGSVWVKISSGGNIVNDLDTDSDTDALSAAMGKELNERLEVVEQSGGGLTYTEDATTIYVTTSGYVDTTPRITANPTEISLSPAVGGTVTKNIVIKGFNLTSPITIALTDASGMYSLSAQSLPAAGGTLVLTYHPTAAGNHNASLLISSSGAESVSVAVAGVASQPTINVSKQSIALKSESGQSATATFRVSGTSLTDDISIAVSGSGFSVSPSTIALADAAGGVDVAVTFDGSADSGSATITISSSGAESVQVAVTYAVAGRLPAGSTFSSSGMTFTVLDDTTKVSVKNNGASGALVIPSVAYDGEGVGYDVTAVAFRAFQNNKNITSVEIPASINTWLGGTGNYSTFAAYSQAFQGCTGLTSLIFRATGQTKAETFIGCTNLRNVQIDEGITMLSTSFFQNCSSIESIVIPDSVASMGQGVFLGCKKLKRIQIGKTSNCALRSLSSSLYAGQYSPSYGRPESPYGIGAGFDGNVANGSLEYIICYSQYVVSPTDANTSTYTFGIGMPPGYRNYNSATPSTGDTIDTNGTGRLYVPATLLNNYRTDTNCTNGVKNWWRQLNDINDATGASGRIYSIEDIGTISGYETDALLTQNNN